MLKISSNATKYCGNSHCAYLKKLRIAASRWLSVEIEFLRSISNQFINSFINFELNISKFSFNKFMCLKSLQNVRKRQNVSLYE